MLELHFIESTLHKGFLKPDNADAKIAFKMAGLHLHTHATMPPIGFLDACTQWNMKVFVRQAGEPISAAKLLNKEVRKYSLSHWRGVK